MATPSRGIGRGNSPASHPLQPCVPWSVWEEVVTLRFDGSQSKRDVMRWLGVSEKTYYVYLKRREVPERWIERALTIL